MKRDKKRIDVRILYSLISLAILILVISGISAINPSTEAYHNSTSINFSGGFNIPTGKIGVGTTSPTRGIHIANEEFVIEQTAGLANYKKWNFYVAGTAGDRQNLYLRLLNDAGTASSVDVMQWSGIGDTYILKDLFVTNDVTAYRFLYSSDKTLKENIQPLTNSLETVKKLQGVSFNWKNTGIGDIGVVAQDIEKVIPVIVHTNEEGLKSVEYGNLVAVLIEAIKEQQIEIDNLNFELKELKSQLED